MQTKYTIAQYVYFMHKDKVARVRVNKIVIEANGSVTYFFSMPKPHTSSDNYNLEIKEDEVFVDKQALIDSL